MATSREFEIVLLGATGFTGRLVAEQLARPDPSDPRPLRWAIAGRSAGKLAEVAAALATISPGAPAPAQLVVDVTDGAALAALAARTSVVCSTVGPYAQHGSGVVAACVAAGTHYCDLTGEAHWVRQMIDRHHAEAQASGARIVHCCGFDSIPSDLGVWYLQRGLIDDGGPAASVLGLVASLRGGASGGTLASMIGVAEAARRDPAARRIMANPHGLDPEPRRHRGEVPDQLGVRWDRALGVVTGPWLMASINRRVVHRSNALLGHTYGADFRYQEVMSRPASPRGAVRALTMAGATLGLLAAAGVPPVAAALARRLPAGAGPDAEARARGRFRLHLVAVDAPGRPMVTVSDDADPGYGSTCKMLAQSATCLARDPLTSPGGITTPAAAMGQHLLARLQAIGPRFERGHWRSA
ncbi:MAG: saccharopine dehydrogenase NADP-binding domain-containing protein [Kofleriaceae bacterium]|nr:saccharopine dehydrogenase NADP-binding domain-containing protein [Kofleriaceae bacterium]MBP6841086.1 saccharopine dehydrogenase NADP-binding domain-containing protein [Kofleriaceae bacterium]